MKLLTWIRTELALAGLLAFGLSATAAVSKPEGANPPLQPRHSAAIRRAMPLRVDLEALQNLRNGDNHELSVPIFDGQTLVLDLKPGREFRNNGWICSGTVRGENGTVAQVAWADGWTGVEIYRVEAPPLTTRPAMDGSPLLCEFDPAALAADSCGTCRAMQSQGLSPIAPITPRGQRSAAPAADPPNKHLVDMMVLYSPSAREKAGGVVQIEQTAWGALELANFAHSISETGAQLRMVRLAEYAFPEGKDGSAALDSIAANRAIQDLARTNRADLVMCLTGVDMDGINGIGHLLPNLDGRGSALYALVEWDKAANDLTFAHEAGHNFGCGHVATDSQPKGIFDYSHGYRFPSEFPIYRTVMAGDNSGVGLIRRVPHYSNPAILYPTLLANYVTGTDSANNARTIRETRGAVRSRFDPVPEYFVYAGCFVCNPGQLKVGDGTRDRPAGRMAYLFDNTADVNNAGFNGVGILSATGLGGNTVARIRIRPDISYGESLRVTRPCRLERWDGFASRAVRIGAP